MCPSNFKINWFFIFCVCLFVFTGCEGDSNIDNKENNSKQSSNKTRLAKGDKAVYGGSLKISEEESFRSIFPLEIVDAISAKIASQIHNGLVKFNAKDLSVNSCIAKNWEIDSSETVYTFELRDNVYFHDDPCFENGKGTKVTANDFKYTFELLCSKDFEHSFNMIKNNIKGAKEFYNGETSELEGVEVVDEHTLRIYLNEPLSSFIYKLAMPNISVISKTAYEKYGVKMKVGAGAFIYTEPENELTDIYLVANTNYFLQDSYGNKLPYLDSVHFHFNESKMIELEMFKQKKISLIHGLPPSKIVEVFAEKSYNFTDSPPQWIVEHDPELVTQYYEFNSSIPPFDDIRVRQAFNYAIDKEKILLNTLKNQGAIGSKGITPNVQLFNKYDFSEIKGYDYNPELAKKLFAEAGYPNGKGFPNVRLELNLGGNTHLLVAQEIQHQLNAILNIWIEFEQVSFSDKIEHSKYGKSEIFRSAWVADYPSPESFLSIFYGGNLPDDKWNDSKKSFNKPCYPNTMRFKNERFDELYLMGIKTKNSNEAERFALFAEAEKIMMEQAPVIILWYQENFTLYHSDIRNFHYNSMEHFDFSDVYLKPLTKKEYNALQNAGDAKVK